jgi:hypothetical protein
VMIHAMHHRGGWFVPGIVIAIDTAVGAWRTTPCMCALRQAAHHRCIICTALVSAARAKVLVSVHEGQAMVHDGMAVAHHVHDGMAQHVHDGMAQRQC